MFLSSPAAVLVPPGSDLTLPCTVANMGEQSQCRWQRDYKPVGLFPGKYSLPPDRTVS